MVPGVVNEASLYCGSGLRAEDPVPGTIRWRKEQESNLPEPSRLTLVLKTRGTTRSHPLPWYETDYDHSLHEMLYRFSAVPALNGFLLSVAKPMPTETFQDATRRPQRPSRLCFCGRRVAPLEGWKLFQDNPLIATSLNCLL